MFTSGIGRALADCTISVSYTHLFDAPLFHDVIKNMKQLGVILYLLCLTTCYELWATPHNVACLLYTSFSVADRSPAGDSGKKDECTDADDPGKLPDQAGCRGEGSYRAGRKSAPEFRTYDRACRREAEGLSDVSRGMRSRRLCGGGLPFLEAGPFGRGGGLKDL